MIIQYINSFVNRPGNIGVRTGRVLNQLRQNGTPAACVCRGVINKGKGIDYNTMGLVGHLPRLLNAMRIYIFPNFNHRSLDIAIFNFFSIHLYAKLLYSHSPKIAHVWEHSPKLINFLKQKGCRVYLDIPMAPLSYVERLHQQNQALFLKVNPSLKKMEKLSFQLADKIIVPSQFVKKEISRAGVSSEKLSIVEFGVSANDSIRVSGQKDKRGLDFCFVGNINLRKGIAELLQAWSTDHFKNDRLHLCGRLFPETIHYLKSARGGKIITPGFINPFSYLKNCDVFVFPSWMEGSSKAVFEAMACGCPVITTPSAGSIVRDGVDGFIVEAGDDVALREKMLWFKDNPKRRDEMGRAGHEKVRMFTWERYAQKVVDLYLLK